MFSVFWNALENEGGGGERTPKKDSFRLRVGRIGPPRDENVALRGEARIPGGQQKSPVSENSLEAVNRSCATNYRRLRAGKSLVIFLLAAVFFFLLDLFWGALERASVRHRASGAICAYSTLRKMIHLQLN
ncbi:hypothetical protein NPIL_185711 [Nephila pilipes]|uniref:Uncharacterized protein n=1 Tax=Nephila pilipes TaxID=299642 RepID=A0A8X6UFJ1_NEPPI|nr:hypothetical protein NPIL_185711 [Nephila pilipes]